MRNFIALTCGALAGAGLMVSGMTDTTGIQGFLDISGDRDPTLASGLGAAVLPMMVAWRIAAARPAPVCAAAFPGPAAARLDPRLLGGAALFGAGWGLVGFRPGPALTALGTGSTEALIFTVAMLTGMLGHRVAFPTSKTA